MRFSSKNYLVLTSISFPFLFISPFSFHLSEVSAYYQNTPFGGFITSQKYTFRRLSPNDLCLFLSDTNKILKRLENSLHKFHRCVSDWLTMSLCETSGFTEGSPSFTPENSVKLGESWWKHKVSPGRAVYQRVIVRWNLWRLFSHLFYFSAFSMVLDSV